MMQQEQDLANALATNDFPTAARLAFALKHPGRLLAVVQRAAAAAVTAATAMGLLTSGRWLLEGGRILVVARGRRVRRAKGGRAQEECGRGNRAVAGRGRRDGAQKGEVQRSCVAPVVT